MQLYRQLMEALDNGRPTALVTRWNGARGTLEKTLAGEGETAADLGSGGLYFRQEGETITLVERFAPKPRLIVLGGGHVALPVCHLGARLGFDVTVYDDRPSFANHKRFPHARRVICHSFSGMAERLELRREDFVVIVTRGHRHDSLCLRALLRGTWPCYVGMIGSRRRVAVVKEQLAEETGAGELLKTLHSPIGLPIGAVTPEEIALSILAEVVRCRRVELGLQAESCPDPQLLEWLAEEHEEPAVLVTIVSAQGSTPREVGAKMVVTALGQTIGSIGGGCAEAEVIRRARTLMEDKGCCLLEVDMTDSAEDDGMVCGGSMQVLLEAMGE